MKLEEFSPEGVAGILGLCERGFFDGFRVPFLTIKFNFFTGFNFNAENAGGWNNDQEIHLGTLSIAPGGKFK